MSKLLHLCMIVKNSGIHIKSMLDSFKPYIDHWTILDTGSTDGTQQIIKQLLEGVPGQLFEEPFVDFAISRNRALELAGQDYTWLIMPDDSYVLKNGKNLREYLKSKKGRKFDALNITIEDTEKKYVSTRISRSKRAFRYKYRIHEYLVAEKIGYIDSEISSLFDETSAFMSSRTFERNQMDYKMLKEDFEKNPEDGRLCFYLARTCKNLGFFDEANKYFEQRVKMGKDGETYESDVELLSNKIIKNTICEDDILNTIKKYSYCQDLIYLLVNFYYINQRYEEAFFHATKYYFKEIEDNLYCATYRKTIDDEIMLTYIDLQFLTDRIPVGIELLKKAIENDPDNIRLNNMKASVCRPTNKPTYLEAPVFAIHSGNKYFPMWDPSNIVNNKSMASGSEIMAVNIAEQMVKLGYRAFIFGHFDFDRKTVNNVEYIHYELFIQFVENYYVDLLIVSRTADNLYYGHNVNKVYLWLHDSSIFNSSPGFVIQTHKEKFKGILCLSEWHKKTLQDQIGLPEDKFIVTRNGIDLNRFVGVEVEKQPYRFIYISSPNRGLTRLLKMFPKIKEKYEMAELYVFCNRVSLEKGNYEVMTNTPGIFYSERISQEQIAIELKKSDVWLYPTHFYETYCITAVEAQLAEVLCCATNIGSLCEVVGKRGILFEKGATDDEILKKLFFVLDNKILKDDLVKQAKKWAMTQDLKKLSQEWVKIYDK